MRRLTKFSDDKRDGEVEREEEEGGEEEEGATAAEDETVMKVNG
jgi:hypothetical protein